MSDVDTVRLLIADLPADEDDRLFTDDEIQAFLDLEGGVRRASAQALDTIATSEVLVSKVIKTQDLTTDGAKVAAELRARAADLRRQAIEAGEGDDTGGLTVVEFDPSYLYFGDASCP
jgi:hypothetical protein